MNTYQRSANPTALIAGTISTMGLTSDGEVPGRITYIYITFFSDDEPLVWLSDQKVLKRDHAIQGLSEARIYRQRGELHSDVLYTDQVGVPMLAMSLTFKSNFRIIEIYYELTNKESWLFRQIPLESKIKTEWIDVAEDYGQCCGKKMRIARQDTEIEL